MTWHSFFGHKYHIFNSILSHLIALKTLKSQKMFGASSTESLVGFCLRPQAVITMNSQLLFSLKNSIFFYKTDICESAWINHQYVVMRLNPFPISFCTVIISQINVPPSLVNYNQLMQIL